MKVMKMNRYIGILIGVVAFFSACQNESLEDTYKDWAGDGEIRYVGKCTDLMVEPGWKRIIVTWQNAEDQIIKQVKVKWRLDEMQDSVLLERGASEYSIESINGQELENENYEISVSSVDVEGRASIPVSTFGRPYTYSHEDVMIFNRIVSNVYVIKDRLVLFFLDWQENMRTASLSYTKADGSTGTLELNEEICNQHYYLLPDKIKPEALNLTVYRKGKLPGCEDMIEFEPYVFSTAKMYEVDFVQEMKRQMGFGDVIPDDWANSVETVYLDFSISSLTNLLNLPNLKKVVLGSRRYLMSEEAVSDELYGQSSVSEVEASDFALEVLHELNGLTVERYNEHFNELADAEYICDISRVGVPDDIQMDFMDLSAWTFTETPENEGFDSHVENLTDNNFETAWDPLYLTSFTTYELTMDMESEKTLNGLRFVQKKWTRAGEIVLAPDYIKIKVSKNGVLWEDATYVEDNPVGKSDGEVNYITFSDDVKASQWRFVQVQLNAGLYGGTYYSGIAEISLW